MCACAIQGAYTVVQGIWCLCHCCMRLAAQKVEHACKICFSTHLEVSYLCKASRRNCFVQPPHLLLLLSPYLSPSPPSAPSFHIVSDSVFAGVAVPLINTATLLSATLSVSAFCVVAAPSFFCPPLFCVASRYGLLPTPRPNVNTEG